MVAQSSRRQFIELPALNIRLKLPVPDLSIKLGEPLAERPQFFGGELLHLFFEAIQSAHGAVLLSYTNERERGWYSKLKSTSMASILRQMTSATIKLFLPLGDAKSLRTAEISNWTGKAVAAPRTEIDELLAREELEKAGIYILMGSDPLTNAPRAYIGEAEIIRDRLKQHKAKEFWVSAIVFVSKDENLTKAHVRYLESRLLAEAGQVNRFTLEQNQAGGSRLPESDRHDMEVFLSCVRQLLPVLGSDILVPIAQPAAKPQPGGVLFCRIKGAEAQGQRTANGFVVFQGSPRQSWSSAHLLRRIRGP